MQSIYLNIPISPVPKARHRTTVRNGKPMAYNSPEARSDIETFVAYARPSFPKEPLSGALKAKILVAF